MKSFLMCLFFFSLPKAPKLNDYFRKDNMVFIYYYGKQVMIVTHKHALELIEGLEFADDEEGQNLRTRLAGNFKC